MAISTIDVGADFSRMPRGLHACDGEHSAERFREEFLKPVFTRPQEYARPVKIILDTALGYGANFLQEAFGGLVREGYATPDEVEAAFRFVHEGYDSYERLIHAYVQDAKPGVHSDAVPGSLLG